VKSFKGLAVRRARDGRARGKFLPEMIGETNYRLCCDVKDTFDPDGILNPNKVVRAPPIDTALRYSPQWPTPDLPTYLDWSRDLGVVRAVERCNGMAECKKVRNGLMCPSYMATLDEKDSTRARANVLREFLTHSTQKNRFDHREIYDVLDLCISCKGCKSECPASVDMAKLKAEFLQHWHDAHPPDLCTRAIADFATLMRLAVPFASLFNLLARNPLTGRAMKAALGFASNRSIPRLCRTTVAEWYRRRRPGVGATGRRVHIFCDEFTNFNDVPVGIAAIKLLVALGYTVVLAHPGESGRAMISKGFLRRARRLADRNVTALHEVIDDEAPLVGLEPSAISCFKDEYPDLVSPQLRGNARTLAGHSLMFEGVHRAGDGCRPDRPRCLHRRSTDGPGACPLPPEGAVLECDGAARPRPAAQLYCSRNPQLLLRHGRLLRLREGALRGVDEDRRNSAAACGPRRRPKRHHRCLRHQLPPPDRGRFLANRPTSCRDPLQRLQNMIYRSWKSFAMQ
jgi:Fe-S oxidoreductase